MIHKAEPAPEFAQDAASVCIHCHRDIKRVPGGQGPTWVHTDTGAVVGSGPSRQVTEKEIQQMSHIANHRFVVQGKRDDDGRRWAIHATDALSDAERVLQAGITVDGRHWTGTKIHDRRIALVPVGGWGA